MIDILKEKVSMVLHLLMMLSQTVASRAAETQAEAAAPVGSRQH